jgi:hypothetical protein
MFSNWKPKLLAIIGFIGTVFGILQFFGVSAKEIGEFMTANYLWLAVAAGSFALFIWGCYAWWKSSRVTLENVHVKVKEWIDTFSLSRSVMQWEPWHFRYDVMFWGHTIFVGRPKATGGHYLQVELRTTGVLPQHAQTFADLTPFARMQFESQIALETARARVHFTRWTPDYSDVSLMARIPISSRLSATDLINALHEVHSGAVIVWNAIALELDRPTPPSLAVDKEASPPKPT